MILGLFALIILSGIVGAAAFLHEGKEAHTDEARHNAADFDIKEE
jgi:hypothetical protein